MAAMTFNAGRHAGQVRGQFETVFASLHALFDAFFSYRMRLAVAATEHGRRRQVVKPTQPPKAAQ